MAFVNRERELEQLDAGIDSARGGTLSLLWGRRRVGETELLRHS